MELKTGRLMAMAAGMAFPVGFERVPDRLQRDAEQLMRAATMNGVAPIVDMRSQQRLAKWGRYRLKQKRKAKIAAKSRRRNRNGKR